MNSKKEVNIKGNIQLNLNELMSSNNNNNKIIKNLIYKQKSPFEKNIDNNISKGILNQKENEKNETIKIMYEEFEINNISYK